MAEKRSGRQQPARVSGRFELAGVEPGGAPELRFEVVDPRGNRVPVEIGKQGNFELDGGQLGKGLVLELGPASGEGQKRTFSYDALYYQLRSEPVYRIPQAIWNGWILPLTCVAGEVSRCWPILLEDREPASLQQLRARLTGVETVYRDAAFGGGTQFLPWPPIFCNTVCQGKVEVYLRVCCCPPFPPPWVVIKNICEIINCQELVWPPDWPPLPPGPGPDPAPDARGMLERISIQAIARARIRSDAPSPERILDLVQHYVTLQTLTLAQQSAYIKERPELIALCCSCFTRKVAEVPIHSDGHFDACFWAGLTPFNCHQRVLYRVLQMQNGAWTVIYDGLATNQSFDLGELAHLYANWNAQTCGDPPPPIIGGVDPFVLLEAIGGTWASELNHTGIETSETTWSALSPQDGTVFPDQRPWATQLGLRYHFGDGMEALGAKYYRTRVIPLTGAGVPKTLMSGLSWSRYHLIGASIDIVSQTLGPNTIGAVSGLYEIPYHRPVEDWLGGQFHAYVATNDGSMPNGQYLFVVDVFDAAGNRLVPAGGPAAGAGEVATAFEYRRMAHVSVTPIPTTVVAQKALPNLFLIDNTPCQGLITGLDQGGLQNQNCLSLSEVAGDVFAVRYYAYQPEHYMRDRYLTIKKGLFGIPNTFDSSTAEVPLPGSDSSSLSIATLLGADKQCSFTVTLVVDPKHWNGSDYVWNYRVIDPVAFALTQP